MEQGSTITIDNYMPATDLVFVSRGNFAFVPFSAIIRISKKGFLLTIVTETGNYSCSESMEEIMRELPVNQFARVQKSHIISLEHWYLLQKFPISGHYKKDLKRKLGSILDREFSTMIFRQKP